ncbi:MAG: branched-chain amino acid ABC transporter permease [Acidobacteriia bacterium]|nr:branched-chain amino acid ABC transporter permease [Methyloceanibacter sp.]MBX5473299.1 branched-chain amino acid ABC transporter permease [Acetobacteraceae bacterium]MCL6492583.1 branched-chain amino acid ABC transporter permease [Terriglobia bacterium]
MAFLDSVESLLQVLLAGVLLGCLYGLMCAGLGLIFGIMRVINFAQGDFMMLAMYLGLNGVALLAPGRAYAFPIAMGVAVLLAVVFYGLGAGTHLLLLRRVSGARILEVEESGHTGQLILTLGLSLVLQNGALMVFGSQPSSIGNAAAESSWVIGPLIGDQIMLFVNQARFWSAVISVVAVAATLLVLTRTGIGRRLRAVAGNPVAALYMGIDIERAFRVAFGIGLALTAIAGVCTATFYPFQPYTGFDFVIIMYAGVVLGGMGSFGGAFAGGLLIGIVQQLSTLILSPQLQNTAVFVVFLAVLLLRPQGLFGRSAERA